MNKKHIKYQDELVCCDSQKPSCHNDSDPFFVPAELAQEASVHQKSGIALSESCRQAALCAEHIGTPAND